LVESSVALWVETLALLTAASSVVYWALKLVGKKADWLAERRVEK
jgi:hypothetical protein